MTVHKSKGLEFDTVIMPAMSGGLMPREETKILVNDKNNAIKHSPVKICDYGKKQYLLVKIGEKENYIDVTSYLKEGNNDVEFTFDHEEPLGVYTLKTNVKIM